MKKNGRKLDRANEARRKAESAELFRELLKAPHLVVTPAKYKGTRQSNTDKAIRESRNDWTIPVNAIAVANKAMTISIQLFAQSARMEKNMDEQAVEIQEALAEYYANPEAYSIDDFEEIFQDRDPFEFL